MNYIFVSNKKWHNTIFLKLKKRDGENWIRIQDRKDLNYKNLKRLKPEVLFIVHWSSRIEENIHVNFKCILFHMTDLPYGRGGSPLQNLILRGHLNTKISAIKVVSELDAGPIYLKEDLKLSGTALQIFKRSSKIIYQMILKILKEEIKPTPQKGEIIHFKRRKPEQGDISGLNDLPEISDYIRMLDCEGYQNAFIKSDSIIYEFYNLKNKKNYLEANVKIKRIK